MWAELDPVRRREQTGRRPALVIASDLYLEQADTLAIIVPVTRNDRGWPNHVPLKGPGLALDQPSSVVTEQTAALLWTPPRLLPCSRAPPGWMGQRSGGIWTRRQTRKSRTVPDRSARGLLDTSVVIDLELLSADQLPDKVAISAITLAELPAGPSAAQDPDERARRQDRLRRAEAVFDPPAFGIEAARAYGRIHAAVVSTGRRPPRRFADLLIASTALAEHLPLITRKRRRLCRLEELITGVQV